MAIVRLAFLIVSLAVAAPISAAEPDWQAVAKALGKEGAIQGGGVYRIGLPRSDLKVIFSTGSTLNPGSPSEAGSPSCRRAMRRWSWAISC